MAGQYQGRQFEGSSGPEEVVQDVGGDGALTKLVKLAVKTVRCAGAGQLTAPATDQWRVRRSGADLGKGFQAVAVTGVRSRGNTRERREGAHHVIARRGCRFSPRGYRSPTRLAGGSRLLTSDPRDIRPFDGRGYWKPVSRSVDNDETQPLGPGAPRAGAFRDVEVR